MNPYDGRQCTISKLATPPRQHYSVFTFMYSLWVDMIFRYSAACGSERCLNTWNYCWSLRFILGTHWICCIYHFSRVWLRFVIHDGTEQTKTPPSTVDRIRRKNIEHYCQFQLSSVSRVQEVALDWLVSGRKYFDSSKDPKIY